MISNPLVMAGLQSNGHLNEDQSSPEDQTPRCTEVVAYQCNHCEELHEEQHDAEACCAEIIAAERAAERFRCPVCADDKPTNFFEATECCLWKILPKNKRLSVVDEMESGSTWMLAIEKAMGNE